MSLSGLNQLAGKLRNVWLSLLLALILLNLAVLFTGLLRGYLLGASPKTPLFAGVRSDLIKPLVPHQPAEVLMDAISISKIDLRAGQERLEKALNNAQLKSQVNQTPALHCMQWGPLLANEQKRVTDALLKWAGKIERQEKAVPVGYIVYLPTEAVQAGVTLKRLADRGISQMFYVSSPGPLQGSISLGLFRDEERALKQKAELVAKGIEGVEIRARPGPIRTFYELKGNEQEMRALVGIFERNPRGQLQACTEGAGGV